MDESLTVPDLLAARVAEDPTQVAMMADGGPSITFAQWLARAEAVARGLLDLGVRRGDRIGLVFAESDWIDFAVAYCAVHLAAGVAVPLSKRRAPDENSRLMLQCGAKVVVRADPAPGRPSSVTPADLARATQRPLPPPPCPDDVAQILFTSGTTGQPKGVVARHANLTAGLRPQPRQRALAHSKHLIHALPIGTNAGQTMLFNALTAAPTVLAMAAYDSERLCHLIELYRIGTVFLVPAMAIDLVNSGALARHDLSSLQLIGSTAAPLPPATAMALSAALPRATLVNYYTSTESAPAQTIMVFDPRRPGSVGRAIHAGDIMVTDDSGRPVTSGETGVIWLRSAQAPREYLDDPAATAAVFRDGWTRMGDIGHLDDAGYLHLADRESDLIITGGFKVSTLHVEAELHTHPAVIDAAVTALPHPVMGSIVGAVLVTSRPLDISELRAYLQPRLAQHEIPARLAVVDSLPRNDAGKVLKRELPRLLGPHRKAHREATFFEGVLVKAWASVLKRQNVHVDDDFFALGGDSLRAAQLAALVEDELHRRMGGSDVFDHPILSKQAAWLETAPSIAHTSRPGRAGGSEDAPRLLHAVQREWVRWMAESSRNRVIPIHVAIQIDEPFDPELARRCLIELVRRHESLRMVVDGPDTWRVLPEAEDLLEVSVIDVVDTADGWAEACRFVESSTGAITRALIARCVQPQNGREGHSLFVLCIEHLACDGWSLGLLLREFALLYSAFKAGNTNPLPPVGLRSSDVARWACDQWPATRQYWQTVLGKQPLLPNPLPGQRIDPPLYEGASCEFTLADIASPHGVTPMRAALTAWVSVLKEHTASPEIAIIAPLAGRTRPDFDDVVGCLIQQPILVPGRAKDTVVSGIDQQFYPFHEFSYLVPHPAYFFYEAWGHSAHLPGLRSSQVALPPELATRWPLPRPDLSPPRLRLTERPSGGWHGCLVYNRHALAHNTIADLAQDFVEQCQRLGR